MNNAYKVASYMNNALIKTKATNMPAFLIGSGTESSDTEAAAPPPPPPEPPKLSGPLSRTPSPFLTRSHI